MILFTKCTTRRLNDFNVYAATRLQVGFIQPDAGAAAALGLSADEAGRGLCVAAADVARPAAAAAAARPLGEDVLRRRGGRAAAISSPSDSAGPDSGSGGARGGRGPRSADKEALFFGGGGGGRGPLPPHAWHCTVCVGINPIVTLE